MIAHIERRPCSITKGLYWVVKVQTVSGPSFEVRMPENQYSRIEKMATGAARRALQAIADKINSTAS